MRTIILTAALLCSASAFAQTTDAPAATTETTTQSTTTTTTDSSMNAQTDATAATTTASAAPTTESGPTTKVLAKGDHYAVHRVMADGTVQVKVLTGDDAEMAMAGKNPPALAAFMSSQPITAGAGTSMPQSTTTTTTEQTTTETTPPEEPKSNQ